jgi:hypothetical protein
MVEKSNYEAKGLSAKGTQIRRWAMIFGVLTLVAYFIEWKALALLCLTVSAVGAIVSSITSKLSVLADVDPVELEHESPEEFYLNLSDPNDESAWHIYTVIPSKAIFMEEVCCGGPPTDTATFEYQLRDDFVFCRLRDVRVDGFYGIRYEVLNGQVLEREIKERDATDSMAQHVEFLMRGTLWHELSGSIRFFILSKNGYRSSYFSNARERIQKGFADLEEAASALGATRGQGYWYEAPKDADERTKQAIRDLQEVQSLERHEISFGEFQDYKDVLQTLDKLAAG